MAVPASGANLGEDVLGVIAALAGDDDVALGQLGDIVRILELGVHRGHRRGLAARVGCGEEHRLDQFEVALGLHAIHQHGADHAAPAHQTYQLLAHITPLCAKKVVPRG
ncbi:hypothetical protein D3C72_1506900 [compost metagenome]